MKAVLRKRKKAKGILFKRVDKRSKSEVAFLERWSKK